VSEQGWPDEVDSDSADQFGGTRSGEFFLDHKVGHRPGGAATKFLGPGKSYPLAGSESLLPFTSKENFLAKIGEPWWQARAVLPGKIFLKPGAAL
jgi:hypothetical protein